MKPIIPINTADIPRVQKLERERREKIIAEVEHAEKHPDYCPFCKKITHKYKKLNGPHIQVKCLNCNRHIGFEKKQSPITEQKLKDFKMPYGKHKGMSLYHIGKNDAKYIQWMLNQGKVTGSLKRHLEAAHELRSY